jgi:hypothetical protein
MGALSPDEAPAGTCTTGGLGVHICAAATDSNLPFWGSIADLVAFFCFCRATIGASEDQARCLRPFNATNSKNFTFSPRC